MTVREIKGNLVKMIDKEAYQARVLDELYMMGYDTRMMKHYRDIGQGKAFGGLEILNQITGSSNDYIYERAVENATRDIAAVGNDIVKLLDMAGFDGATYHEATKKSMSQTSEYNA